MRSGALPTGRAGVVISQRAAEDLHIRLGQSLTIRYPVPTGPTSYQLATKTLPVTGINTSPLRYVTYANQSAQASMVLGGLVNRVSVVPAAGSSAADVKRALLALPAITAVQSASAGADAVAATTAQFTDVLFVTVAIAIAMIMALLMAYNTVAINADERTREHATMFAYGVTPARVLRGNITEALITGLLATAIGVAAGYWILRWIIGVSMRNTMPDLGSLVSISAPTFALAALAGIVSAALAPLLTRRRLGNTDIPSALRVLE